ncbi:protein-glutamate O-methyltransferase [uncultured Desulfobacter sp.]|uniref:CheR family methyltransferase n=1 Tax=uncultured Desulfobacter sp. TaxID=240139 RepID=UPI002AAB3441|nr:protein-glutamate O-methyltransferase [uncultured Desulfobacter sp.]
MNFSSQPLLAMEDFRRLGDYIHTELGIKMPDAKRGMIESRLRKRLNALNISSYEEYCDYLFSPGGQKHELPFFINQVTTNKTDFFRESRQFVFLEKQALPELLSSFPPGGRKKLNVWSSACSSGHEPYTLAMVLAEYAEQNKNIDFSILGTDISTGVLDVAYKAVYAHDEIEPVPMALRKKYLLRSKDRDKNTVRIVPQLRSKTRFRRLNLMDKRYTSIEQMDIIFCRNVMIYFERQTQNRILHKLLYHLKPGGFLFMGHSEIIPYTEFALKPVQTTIYQKVGNGKILKT